MVYTTKTPDDFLSYHEWAQIDQPVASWSLFNSDEGNMKKNDKFDIEITLFNGYDYKSSKKIDDNKACSKDFNPLVECLCHQYLYLKPGEICMLEFSINNKNINYKDLILDVNNDKINIISSNVKEGKIEVQLQSLFSESYMPITLPELQVKSANKSSLIYSLAIIPCKKMEYDIDFLSLNCTINCHFYESGPNGETDVTKSFPFENNIDYQDINRVLNSIYNPINIWFNLNPPKQTVDYTFTEFNDLNNVSFLDDDILTESERSITYYFSSLNDDNQEFNRFLDDYTTQNHTIVWLPMLIDYYAGNRSVKAH